MTDDRPEQALVTAEIPARCRGFRWVGQTRRACEGCGKPEWEHDGWWTPSSGKFSFNDPGVLAPWTPEQAQHMAKVRAAWDRNAVYETQTRYETDYLQRQSEVTVRVRYGRDIPNGEEVEVVSRRAC